MERIKVDGDGVETYLFDSFVPVFTTKHWKNANDKFEVEFLLSLYYERFSNISVQRTRCRWWRDKQLPISLVKKN